ncbi:MAG: hypothetical protein GY743_04065 [Planctomycetaceae bacterium]|nr:hypothetical protein [Planctomycetaceae bacterium]
MEKQRKKYFVDNSVQGAILVRLCMYFVLFVLSAGALLFFVEALIDDPRKAGANFLQRYGPTILAGLVLTPIFFLDLCKLTNRFAGPMVRLRRSMNALADGEEVNPLHFRDGDFWQELAEDFNRVIARLETAEQTAAEPTTQITDVPEMESV